MKKGHLALIFCMIAASLFLTMWIEQKKYEDVRKEKERMEESLRYAISISVQELTGVMLETEEVKRMVFRESFFRAWNVRLGVMGNEDEQERLNLHMPLLGYLSEEGASFLFLKEERTGGKTRLIREWSEKIPYYLTEDENENRRILTAFLEEQVSEYLTEHNRIAKQYGLEYEFYVPHFLNDPEKELGFPIVFAVFQGWPLEGSGRYLYENCIDANAYITQKDNP